MGQGPYGDRALSEKEQAQLWPSLTGANLPPYVADILRLQIALGARCGEVYGIDALETWPPPSGRCLQAA